jgi:hypothetical protein
MIDGVSEYYFLFIGHKPSEFDGKKGVCFYNLDDVLIMDYQPKECTRPPVTIG